MGSGQRHDHVEPGAVEEGEQREVEVHIALGCQVDISEHGIVLAGRGVLLRDFPQRLRAETGLPVQLVAEPLTCVAVGAGRCLDEPGAIAWAAKPAKRRRHPGSRRLRSSWRR